VPLDFAGNRDRILESIRLAKEGGARLRTGPELEICGYGCLDHFLEGDTFLHSWEVLAEILANPICKGMLLDIGIPVRHRNVRYNARVLATYRHIYGLRAKQSLANNGLYREARHFSAWEKAREVQVYYLEQCARACTGQDTCPIGDFILSAVDTAIACETCEEMFTPLNPSSFTGLNGAEIILNSSASHAELRKLRTRLELITNCTRKLGGVYVYANATGIDGEARMLFDGSSMVIVNGEVVAQSSQFSLKSVEVTVATVDVEQVRSFRATHSRGVQAARQDEYPRIECGLVLGRGSDEIYLSDTLRLAKPMEMRILQSEEEIHYATAVWLWQYLVRSNAGGLFLALSGGLDSSTVALFVYGMARLVLRSVESGEEETLKDLRRVTGLPNFRPKKAEDIVSLLFHTAYMGTVHSSQETASRARRLAETIGAYHSDIVMDDAVLAFETIAGNALGGFKPRFGSEGGTPAESLARQNVRYRPAFVHGVESPNHLAGSRVLIRSSQSLWTGPGTQSPCLGLRARTALDHRTPAAPRWCCLASPGIWKR
jgi:NAD+ synthase (glutamine-hydrolysing)